MDKKKDLASKLRTSGLRPTKQRVKLADFLFNRDKTFHFTVEDLDKAMNKKNSDDRIALATIYNTIHAFKKAGHLKEILILLIPHFELCNFCYCKERFVTTHSTQNSSKSVPVPHF